MSIYNFIYLTLKKDSLDKEQNTIHIYLLTFLLIKKKDNVHFFQKTTPPSHLLHLPHCLHQLLLEQSFSSPIVPAPPTQNHLEHEKSIKLEKIKKKMKI